MYLRNSPGAQRLGNFMLSRAYAPRPNLYLAEHRGFSLVELVVVIAILATLISLAMPAFVNIRKDAQINQAKNTLVAIVKECAIAETRERSTELLDIQSAKAALSGMILLSQGQRGNSFLSGNCFKDVNGSREITVSAMADKPSEQEAMALMPIFAIGYNPVSGAVIRECLIDSTTEYKAGCSASWMPCTRNRFGQLICPPENGIGSW